MSRVLAALFVSVLSFAPAQVQSPHAAGDLSFTIPSRGTTTLSALKGKPVLLALISTTCSHCVSTVQMMGRLREEFAGANLQLVAVAINPNAEVLVEDLAKEQHATFPIGYATREKAREFLAVSRAERFDVPQILFLDSAGVVVFRTTPRGEDSLRSEGVLRQRLCQRLNAAGCRLVQSSQK